MSKEPWGNGTPWKNSVAFFTYLRSCLRKSWSNCPTKHNLLKKKRYQIPNPNKAGKKPTVFGAECAMCGGEFPLSQIQVDHIHAAGSLQKKEDIQGFVERLLFVTEDDLRLVCKGCNACLAYSDKHKVSFNEARAIKEAIRLCKEGKDVDWLEQRGIIASTAKAKRRTQIEKILLEELTIGNT